MPRQGVAAVAVTALLAACGKSRVPRDDAVDRAAIVSAPNAIAPGAPRKGMVWISPGVLRAGTGLEEVPRIADAELPGVEVPLGGFYVDVLPWPNEAGAIPTTNVTREEAKRLCEGKSKRLCSELEWERACKGPDNARYEYGATYDPRVCGAGAPTDDAPPRPSGERPACRSAFGARDLHGGAREWTDSAWGRGSTRELGVLRAGGGALGAVAPR